jgi:hypothetical protein
VRGVARSAPASSPKSSSRNIQRGDARDTEVRLTARGSGSLMG